MSRAPAFLLRTYGCQMNVHDSEKVANLLLHHGWVEARELDEADLLVVNTCSIRAKAEDRLYSDLGALRAWRSARPGRVIGVAGCVAQQEGDAILRRFPQVDFVYGTHNLRHVPAMLEAARRGRRLLRVDESRSQERFELPDRHPDFESRSPGRAYVTVMEGCDMYCSFCIVPRTRGREISRPADEIVAEARELAGWGVREITLLGQTVNAYGRPRPGADSAARVPFAELLRRIAAIPGIARVRYTSPHPIFFDPELIRAHGELPELCPHVHLPVQSGSDAVLARMRRRHGAEAYLRLADALRRARPDIALTTDLIVGFPGESDAEFRDTLALVRQVGFVDSFSFKYSPRPGTAAARLGDPVEPERAQERLEELQSLQRSLTLAWHRGRVGQQTEVLVEGPSRRGGSQQSGRDPYHRVVNWEPRGRGPTPPGRLLRMTLVEATPHSLIGEPLARIGEPRPASQRAVKPEARRADEARRTAASGG